MFSKVALKHDTQLSPTEIANLLLDDALLKLSQLSGLNKREAFDVLLTQISSSDPIKRPPTSLSKTPILEAKEMQFITQLFH